MAKITLRAYNRQIDELIEREQYQEAIAHCRHILETFPKHVATYRLLGKAYLEVRRYKEASDVFQRVLAAIPDDFVAHAALSVIHHETGDAKTALWHMERAFEVQPSNPAIQDELRRLYAEVEGFAPPRLRLTRGALARMYLRNGLYAQAIAELQSALAAEPHRADLMALLAEALYRDGRRAEAADVAASLLKKLPYCLSANRLMAEILEESGRSEDAEIYRQRLYALDPYEAYRTAAIRSVDQVPDEAVMLERLEWTPEMAAALWEEPLADLETETVAESEEEELPSWFHEPEDLAAETTEEVGIIEEEGAFAEAEDEEELAPAEIPDWLKEMAPEDVLGGEDDLLASEEDENLASLLADLGGVASEAVAEEKSEDLPDWLGEVEEAAGVVAEAPAEAEEALPDWLGDLGEEETSPVTVGEAPAAEGDEDLPDWLQGLGEEAAPTETLADEPAAQAEEELPDWLQGLGEEETAAEAP
ncbi:MAG: tetratricopeptide repeat protein, partial [Chloroflexi bacterium]|nr:tetratricopeptide repeat protein [Chloroflexota bacterium]